VFSARKLREVGQRSPAILVVLAGTLMRALRGNDLTTARAAHSRLTDAYLAHRAIVDRLVERANKQNSNLETMVTDGDRSILYVVRSVSAIVFLFGTAGVFSLADGVVRPMIHHRNHEVDCIERPFG
jgi:hypothetical protein